MALGLFDILVEVLVFQLPFSGSSFCTISSTKVFHSPHEVHRPSHLGELRPQFWQKYEVFVLAILKWNRGKCLFGCLFSEMAHFLSVKSAVAFQEMMQEYRLNKN